MILIMPLSTLSKAAQKLGASHEKRFGGLLSAFSVSGDRVAVLDPKLLRADIGVLPEIAAFGGEPARFAAHRLALALAYASGIFPASIDALYAQMGRGACRQFTVPAMNMRAVAYESARGVFRAMAEHRVAAAIFELSRGEIGFTGQRPHEYACAILCAAIKEGHRGPIFLQGDHFQISASRYAIDPDVEKNAVKALIAEAVNAGFYNIDIDASTLVDLSFTDVAKQQELNARLTAELAIFTRSIEPDGVSVSLGGEIGEVGEENSTMVEVEAYLTGVRARLPEGMRGLSKLSIQSGTRHGGNVLPDGSFGDMNVDFALISKLTAACRQTDKLAGSVQHGASMLSLEKISNLPAADCIEVHLAAAFLNAVYAELPAELVTKADDWAKKTHGDEWKADWTEAQFLHHARRYPIGPFKREWWSATECHEAIRMAVGKAASGYFQALAVTDTQDIVAETIATQIVPWSAYKPLGAAALDEASIKDLAD
jgi:fructose/tagatose bisphosphate aldolase